MDVDVTDLLNSLITAVGGNNWASVILLVVVLVTLLGEGFLIYRRMQANERVMMRMLDKVTETHLEVRELDHAKDGS